MKSPALKIIFAGTPEFSAVALQALLHSQHSVQAVYTQPDRPAGRGRKLTTSPVKELALQHNLPIYQPLSLRDASEQRILADLQADVMVVAAYGLLLPQAVLAAPRLGCVNIHTSLLPQWRGAAPIQRAIFSGDTQTGITIIQMDEGLDTGPILLQKKCPIEGIDTSSSLHDKLAHLGAEAILETLQDLAAGTVKMQAQDNARASYAKKITKEEARINWHTSAKELDQKIRAFNPWPIAYMGPLESAIRIWQATVIPATHRQEPGTIVNISADGIDVATHENILRLQKLQFPGGKVLAAHDILNSRQQEFAVGTILG